MNKKRKKMEVKEFEILHNQYENLKENIKTQKARTDAESDWNFNPAKALLEEMVCKITELMGKLSKNEKLYYRLLAMEGALHYQHAKVLVHFKKTDKASDILKYTTKRLKDHFLVPEITFLELRVLNHYCYLLTKCGDLDTSQELLELAEEQYLKLKSQNEFECYSNDDLFVASLDLKPSKEINEKLERLVTNNLQMLGFVYSKQGKMDKFAVYHHEVLRRQLDMREGDATVWAMKTARLGYFFMTRNKFVQARHHLAAACYVLSQYENTLKTLETTDLVLSKYVSFVAKRFSHKTTSILSFWHVLFASVSQTVNQIAFGITRSVGGLDTYVDIVRLAGNVFTHEPPETFYVWQQLGKINSIHAVLPIKYPKVIFGIIPQIYVNIQYCSILSMWEELNHRYADIAKCWVKYGLFLFNASRLKLVSTFYGGSPALVDTLWTNPLDRFVYRSNVRPEDDGDDLHGIWTCDTRKNFAEGLRPSEGTTDLKSTEEGRQLKCESFSKSSISLNPASDIFDVLFRNNNPSTVSIGVLPAEINQRTSVKTDSDPDVPKLEKQDCQDEEDFKFPSLDLSCFESCVSCSYVENLQSARDLFLFTHSWLKKSKLFYTLKDHPMEYVNVILDLSELYRYLAFYEDDVENQYSLQKRRADTLETLSTVLKEIRPQCYIAISIELLRELAEVHLELMSLNLRRLYLTHSDPVNQDSKPTSQYFSELSEEALRKMKAVADMHLRLSKLGDNLGHGALGDFESGGCLPNEIQSGDAILTNFDSLFDCYENRF